MKQVSIAATASYLPERRVHNDELAQTLETSDEWIRSHTGIQWRHIAADDESTSSFSLKVASEVLDQSGVAAEDLGMIIVATSTPDYMNLPAVACLVQAGLNAVNACAFDLKAACTGFVYGVEIAKNYIAVDGRPALVIGCDLMSRALDWNDYTTCVLFGDGAGAVLLTPTSENEESRVLGSYLRADGTGAELLKIEGGYRTKDSPRHELSHVVQMQGHPVFNFAVRALAEVVETLMQKNEWDAESLDFVVPHQANHRIIRAAAGRLALPKGRFYINVQDVANTSAASIPIALDEMCRKGLLEKGHRVITAGFGAGLTYGGNSLIW